MQIKRFQHGEIIFREGEESDFAYIVEQGTVEVFKRLRNGTVLLATLGPGEIFGEMGLISDLPRSASAAADGPVVVKELSREFFSTMLQGEAPEMLLTIKALMERLRETNQKVSKLVDKQSQFQLASSEPPPVKRVVISPLSNFLKEQMGKGLAVSIPFRVGALPEGAQENPLDWNNLQISGADPSIMARNHFAIQRGQNGLYVVDRGSRTGTIVNEMAIGGDYELYQHDLRPGDNTVIAGDELSPYRFCITWETD